MNREVTLTSCADRGDWRNRTLETFASSFLEDSIIDRFEAMVRRFPSRLAVQDTAVSLTYAELAGLVGRIAAATAATTADREGPVALFLPADANLPAAMLGVAAAGRAYVALDVEFPAEHNQTIVADAGACAVVTCGANTSAARTLFPEIPIIDVEHCRLVAHPPPRHPIGPDDLAAIYYTSGSSGRPKGIALSHRNLLHRVRAFTFAAGISSVDRTLLVSSPSVSVSYRSIFCALFNGASVHIVLPGRVGLAALIGEIRARRITIYHSAQPLVRAIAESLGSEERLDTVRLVHVGGDRVRWTNVDECKRCFSPDVRIHMSLSSTEAGPCIYWFVEDAPRDSTANPPVGRPAPGCRVTIVGDDGKPAADGETGEIVVTSSLVALGHWQESKIRALPIDPTDAQARVFISGDRGRRRADGLIEFIGRDDQRIKLRGHRIELSEIENALANLRHVSDAAVVVRQGADGSPLSLAAYVVLRPGVRGLLPRHVRTMLAQRLPHYMVPSQIYFSGELPRLPNLKLDRPALAQIDAAERASKRGRLSDPHVHEVAGVFESVIGVCGATPEDTIASLGGDSLQELKVFAELESLYGLKIPDEIISNRPPISSIALWIAGQRSVRITSRS